MSPDKNAADEAKSILCVGGAHQLSESGEAPSKITKVLSAILQKSSLCTTTFPKDVRVEVMLMS